MIFIFHRTLVLVNNPTTKHGIVANGLIQHTGYNQYSRLIKLSSLLTDQVYVKQTVKLVAHEFNFNKPCQKKKCNWKFRQTTNDTISWRVELGNQMIQSNFQENCMHVFSTNGFKEYNQIKEPWSLTEKKLGLKSLLIALVFIIEFSLSLKIN